MTWRRKKAWQFAPARWEQFLQSIANFLTNCCIAPNLESAPSDVNVEFDPCARAAGGTCLAPWGQARKGKSCAGITRWVYSVCRWGTKTEILDQEMSMKKLLCVVLWFLPVMLFAQSPFDGTWKTNMAAAKLSQKPYEFSLNNGMYDCTSEE